MLAVNTWVRDHGPRASSGQPTSLGVEMRWMDEDELARNTNKREADEEGFHHHVGQCLFLELPSSRLLARTNCR